MSPKRWNIVNSKKESACYRTNAAADAPKPTMSIDHASSVTSSSCRVTPNSTHKSILTPKPHNLPKNNTGGNSSDPCVEVKRIIADNNLLGISDGEIGNMANILLTCDTLDELRNWTADTLMLSDGIHRQIVTLRDEYQKRSAVRGPTQSHVNNPPHTQEATITTEKSSWNTGKEVANSTLPAPQELPSLMTTDPNANKTRGSTTLSLAAKTTNAKGIGDRRNRTSRGVNKETVSLASLAESLIVGKFFECGCFATQHKYVANCANCGRIFCEQEVPTAAAGSYAAKAHGLSFDTMECYFCGMPPNTCVAYEIRVQQGLVDSMSQAKHESGLLEAQERRDNLLRYAKEKTKRTVVIDDQVEGSLIGTGTNTTWMSADEVHEAEERERKRQVLAMHKHTGAYRIHLDIVNQALNLGATSCEDMDGASHNANTDEYNDSCVVTTETLEHQKNVQLYDLPDQQSVDRNVGRKQWGPVIGNTTNLTPRGANHNPDTTSKEEYIYDDTDDCSTDYEDAPRIAAMPELQRIWYQEGTDDMHKVIDEKENMHSNSDKFGDKESIPRQSVTSKRVQNDYYEENKQRWFEEQHDALTMKRKMMSTNKGIIEKEVESSGANLSCHISAHPSPSSTSGQSFTPWSSDDGLCLTLHQPWASLLVCGIMRHEGRSWPTDVRGRVWIHAAAAEPVGTEAIEARYIPFMPKGAKMPKEYPQSCLLGYVEISDCLSKEEYQKRYPNPDDRQDKTSEYIFLCETGSRVLPFPLPMSGKHKIYKLERKVWVAARKQLGETN